MKFERNRWLCSKQCYKSWKNTGGYIVHKHGAERGHLGCLGLILFTEFFYMDKVQGVSKDTD